MPSRITLTVDPPSVVAVTGANGFIAQHCVAALLSHGYHVVGTVRSEDKVEIVRKTHKWHARLQVVVVEDITNTKSYLSVLASRSPSAILHLASPFSYAVDNFEQDLMIPSVQGAIALLEAAASMPSVKRVVQTNSFACVFDAEAGPCPETTYSARDWSPLTYQDGVVATNAPAAYRASKAAAEKAAWKFMEKGGVGFDLVSLCPGMVFGPFLQGARPNSIKNLNTSNALVWSVISAGQDNAPPPTRGPVWVDVRDVAEAHVKSLIVPEAGGSRFLLAEGVYCNQEIADMARARFPKYRERISVGCVGRRESQTHFGVDSQSAVKVLGMRWLTLDESLRDLVPQLYEIERASS